MTDKPKKTRYVVIHDSLYYGPTGRDIARRGGSDAWLLASVLMVHPYGNAIGLYCLPTSAIEIPGWNTQRVAAAMLALEAAGFIEYDDLSGYVWIKEFVRYQFYLKSKTDTLKAHDRRLKMAGTLFHAVPQSKIKDSFFRRYRSTLGLGSHTFIKKPKTFRHLRGIRQGYPTGV